MKKQFQPDKEGVESAVILPPSRRLCPNLFTPVLVTTDDARDELVYELERAQRASFDTETTGLRVDRDKIIGACISVPPWQKGYYLPLYNSPEGTCWYQDERTFQKTHRLLKAFLESDIPKDFWNALYDVPIVYLNLGIVIHNIAEDGMLKSHVIDAEQEHGLKENAIKLVHHEADWYEAELKRYNYFVGGTEDNPKYWLLPVEKVTEYGGGDAVFTGRIISIFDEMLIPELRQVYEGISMKLTRELMDMRTTGIPLDKEYLRRGQQWYAAKLQIITQEIRKMVKEPNLNPGSFEQLNDVLYKKLGLKGKRKTAKGYSTDEEEMKRLKGQHPVVDLILDYREVQKLEGTYFTGLLGDIGPDGFYRPDISQVKRTGRLGMSRVHQIPRGPLVRRAFIAPEGWVLLGGDHSQLEARVLAHYSKDPELCTIYREDRDVHCATAKFMFNLDCDVNDVKKLHPDKRQDAKAQPVDSGILTPYGWKRFGDLCVGEEVIGSNGFPTIVTGIYPQGLKEVFRVETSDGAATEMCEEHLLRVQFYSSTFGGRKVRRWATLPLGELIKRGLRRKGRNKQPKYTLPDRPIIHFSSQKKLPINPYVLGLLLGDGGFTHNWAPMFGSSDRELLDSVRKEHEKLGGFWISEKETSPGFWRAYLGMEEKGSRWHIVKNPTKETLKELGVWGKRDYEKFIPPQYLLASPEDRLALLQGLLDTDGNVLSSGGEFKNTSKNLALGVQEIVRSLGGWASFRCRGARKTPFHTKSDPLTQWVVYFRLPDNMLPFRLRRKLNARKTICYTLRQTIRKTQSIGLKETQCISVSNPDGLYITDDYVVVHNTINFALLYLESVFGLARQLEIPYAEAQVYYDKFFQLYSGIPEWAKIEIATAKALGYVSMVCGRRRYLPELREFGDIPNPPRYPKQRRECYGKTRHQFGGMGLSIEFDLSLDYTEWTPEVANNFRPVVANAGKHICAGCDHLWSCYYTAELRRLKKLLEHAERQSLNTKIQGSAADLVGLGIIRTGELLSKNDYPAHLVLYIHDEVHYLVPTDSNVDLFAKDFRRAMESVSEYVDVPLIFEPKVGKCWSDVK